MTVIKSLEEVAMMKQAGKVELHSVLLVRTARVGDKTDLPVGGQSPVQKIVDFVSGQEKEDKQPPPSLLDEAKSQNRFTDNKDGTITDNKTGLMWLKDGKCLGSGTWSEALDKIGQFNKASSRFNCLEHSQSFSDWALPNRNELRSVIDHLQDLPALPADHPFTGVLHDAGYWSSTTFALDTDLAWYLYLDMGSVSPEPYKHYSLYVWPVRGGQ